MPMQINYLIVKKVFSSNKAFVFKGDGIGIKRANFKIARLKYLKGVKIMPEELATFQFLPRVIQHKSGGEGVYKLCPLYKGKRGIHYPVIAFKVSKRADNSHVATIYEPVSGQFEEWHAIKNIIC